MKITKKQLRKLIAEQLQTLFEDEDIVKQWGGANPISKDRVFDTDTELDAATTAKQAAMSDIGSDQDTKQWEDSEDSDVQEPSDEELKNLMLNLRNVSENYPAGAEFDSNAPWNQEDEPDDKIESITPHPEFDGDYQVNYYNYQPYHLSGNELADLGYWPEDADQPVVNLDNVDNLPEDLDAYLRSKAEV